MKKCKSCQTEIDNKAKKCPHCQADQRNWFIKHKILTGILIIIIIAIISNMSGGEKSSSTTGITEQQTQEQTVTNEPTQTNITTTLAPTKVAVKATDVPVQTKQSIPVSSETTSQKNAVKKAKSYLSFSGFSHDGLVAQLEYEKFSHEDAVYGADNSGGNWNEQAAKKAKSYMDMSAFSRGSLIEQLKYEKFTQEQAEYGANAVGL
ncbi:MAG: Ltp family lipoprotein [Candidatus Shapirobacteria bacterium]|nr:Ltp family lipoprotein [Candidatus Shapirobacteria bacterium]